MAGSVIGALRVNLGLDSAQFMKGAKGAKTASQQLARDFKMLAAAGAGLILMLSGLAKRGGDDIDRLAKAGRRLDTGVLGMRALELAAVEAGVGVGNITDAVQNLDREVAAGSAGASRALGRLRLAASDLIGLEADEKLALIADRVKDLGLSTGETSQLLRDLGIRNRDMVLLLAQGGDALRSARSDIEDYGLAVSQVDASAIEAANDQIGRLGLISTFAGQELARNLVPAMGRLAESMTNSLREGGALRRVIEAVANQSQRLMSIALAAVGAFAAYRTILLGVAAAKWLVVGASNGLRVALLRLGLPALIIGMGEIIHQFGRLSVATGGWGNALDALGDLARAVWDGIKISAQALGPALGAVWMDIKAGFFQMAAEIQWRWSELLGAIAQGMRQIPFIGDEVADKIAASGRKSAEGWEGFNTAARGAAGAADQLRAQAAQMASGGVDVARAALARLNGILGNTTEEGGEAAAAARDLAAALDDVAGGGGGGGGARGAAAGVEELNDKMQELDAASREVEGSFESAFVGIVTGSMKARDAIAKLLQDLARLLAQKAFQSLFGSFFGGFAGLFDKGGNIPAGQVGIVGEYGPEFVRGPAHVTSRADTARALRGGQSDPVQVVVRLEPSGEFDARVESTARAVVRVEGPKQIGAAFARGRETRAFR